MPKNGVGKRLAQMGRAASAEREASVRAVDKIRPLVRIYLDAQHGRLIDRSRIDKHVLRESSSSLFFPPGSMNGCP